MPTAKKAATEAEEVAVEEEQSDEVGVDLTTGDLPPTPEPPVNAIHPYQLPANTVAAQAMVDAGQVAVLPLADPYPDALVPLAQEAIIDYGSPDTDPRMEGYTPPNGGGGGNGGGGDNTLTITSVTPDTAPANTVTTVTINGRNLDQTHGNPTIGKSCHNTQINSPLELKTDTPGNQAAGTFPVVITLADGTTEITGPDFTYT